MALNPDEQAWMERLIDAYNRDNSKLSDWELGFFQDQLKRWDDYGADIRFSPKQWSIMDRIADKFKLPGHNSEVVQSRDTHVSQDDDRPPVELGDDIPF